ncbi:MAG TPA: WecB/TagA/CpsF family glycosyltransferase [Candidatus Limnocylindria bacterium]|jgi:N-acetylglucosaminyldiphosphoundecaprenol N-acetyl-beta-D-mannosaminyltransferase|nr:WecB/TagA/CpsF family glycosyltransferase [Candidatus Limnocylindria bacterium]
MASFGVLGARVDAVGRDEAVEQIAALANRSAGSRQAAPALVVTLGVEMVMAARRNAAFRRVINGAALVTCDTIGLLLASRLRGGPLRERVTGVELVGALAARSARRGDVRLYLLGGGGDTAVRAAEALRRGYPGVLIAGARDGYFREAESAAVTDAIRASGANVLLAGLGSPKQELWLAAHLAASGCGVGIGVGGSFDVYAGNVERAPVLVQRTGLEWLYRLVKEPRRWRRQLALPHFALAALGEALGERGKGKR